MTKLKVNKKVRPKSITPDERVNLVSHKPVKTSTNIGWSTVRVEEYERQVPGRLVMPPIDHHLLVCHCRPPLGPFTHKYGDSSNSGNLIPFDFTYVPANVDSYWRFENEPHTFCSSFHILLPASFLSYTSLTAHDQDPSRIEFIGNFGKQDKRLLNFFELFKNELENNENGTLFVESLSTALAVYLLRNYTNQNKSSKSKIGCLSKAQITSTIELMRANISGKLTLEDMAKNVSLSSYHFARAFRNTMNIPPHKYFMDLRIKHAKVLLISKPDYSLSHIAYEVGFSDHSHMTNLFYKRLGITPSQYRMANQ